LVNIWPSYSQNKKGALFMVHSVVSLFLAFVGLLFILYKLIATAAISSFDVLAKTSFPEE